MNHNDLQLIDTPTCRAAFAPAQPEDQCEMASLDLSGPECRYANCRCAPTRAVLVTAQVLGHLHGQRGLERSRARF